MTLISLCSTDMWEVCAFLSPGNSYLASGIVFLAWFFTLAGYLCKWRHSLRLNYTTEMLLMCWTGVKSDSGYSCQLSGSKEGAELLPSSRINLCMQIWYLVWDFSRDFTVLRWDTRSGTWISTSEPKPQVCCASFYLPWLKWNLFSGVITVTHY